MNNSANFSELVTNVVYNFQDILVSSVAGL